ncbi:trypsin-like serine protease [Vibrio alginolyticus]|nr:trypsin-like serine protease [Vibrio alginolyticus]
MKKTQIVVPLALLFNITPSVYALENGTSVTESDYDSHNYIVQIHDVASNANCGAQLVASNWLLTARHCTPCYSKNTSFDEDPQYQGEEMELKIYQGVEGNNLDCHRSPRQISPIY